jgi:hypothetical protein
MVSATVACLPTAVNLLLLEALFMQISGVSLALTWPCRVCLVRVLCGSLCYRLSPFQALGKVTLPPRCQACVFIYSSCGRWVFSPLLWSFPPTATFTSFPAPAYWAVLLLLPAALFVYSSRGKWVFPPLLRSFPPSATLTSFPAPGCWTCTSAPARGSLAHPAYLFTVYLQSREGFPSPNLQCSGCPTLFPACLYCSYCLLLSFSFFPGWRLVCPGGMLLWPRLVCGSTAVPWSSPGLRLPKPSGHRQLAARGPPCFSVYREVEILCASWKCGGVKVMPFLSDYACKVCLWRLSKISL